MTDFSRSKVEGFEMFLEAFSKLPDAQLWIFDKNTKEKTLLGSQIVLSFEAWSASLLPHTREDVLRAYLSGERCSEISYFARDEKGSVLAFHDVAVNGKAPVEYLVFGVSLIIERDIDAAAFEHSEAERLKKVLRCNRDAVHDIRTPLGSLMNASELLQGPNAISHLARVAEIVRTQVLRVKEMLARFPLDSNSIENCSAHSDASTESSNG